MSKIKVLQIGGNLRINGISTFIINLYREIYNEFQFIFINSASNKGHYEDEIISLGGKIYNIYTDKEGIERREIHLKKIKKIIKLEKDIQVIHTHYYSINGYVLEVAAKNDISIRIAHCHQAKPNILQNEDELNELIINRDKIKKYGTHYFAITNAAKKFCYGDFGEVLYTPIDINKFYPIYNKNELLNKYNLPTNHKYLIFIGRFAKQKNLPFLLKVFKELHDILKDITLLIVGYGPEEKIIDEFIDVKIKGNIRVYSPDSNINELLNIADALLLPSLWEGYGIVTIEAQAVGLKCFVSNNVPKECNNGLCEFLELDIDLWIKTISKFLLDKSNKINVDTNKIPSIKNISKKIKTIYTYIDKRKIDLLLSKYKEYSLGSKKHPHSDEKAFDILKKCFKYNIRCRFYYALAFFEGKGIEKDIKIAKELIADYISVYKERAKNNENLYQLIIGDMYSFGFFFKQDLRKAFNYYKNAAIQENKEAQCNLGYMYFEGLGVEQSFEKAAFWWLKSANAGYTHSFRDIGKLYFTGKGIKKDYKKAVHWFKKAHENNYVHGTTDLAICYYYGYGVDKNINKAIELFNKAEKLDEDRCFRDLIANDFDIDEYKINNKLVKNKINKIDKTTISKLIYNDTLIIGKHINEIDFSCFYDIKLSRIIVEQDNDVFYATNGILFSKDKKTILKYPTQKKGNSYTIPEGVTRIGEYCFQNCRNLKTISITNNVKQIDAGAFDDCKNMESIKLSNSIKEIGDWCFHANDKLVKIELPENIEHLGHYALGSCVNLGKIIISSENKYYTTINGNLFTKDKTVLIQYAIGKKDRIYNLPKSVTHIKYRAFSDAKYLEKIVIDSIVSMEEKVFTYCKNLSIVVFNKFHEFNFENCFDNLIPTFQIILNDKKDIIMEELKKKKFTKVLNMIN